MVIDTSAIVAILLGEPEAETLALAISRDGKRLVAAFTQLECAVVLMARKGDLAVRDLDLFLHRAGIDTVGMDMHQVAVARDAYERFGRGRHAAGLNLGDCCSYALARVTGEPLLYKGEDFAKTDVPAAGEGG